MANLGEQIDADAVKFGSDLVSWKQTIVMPNYSEVEYYVTDKATGLVVAVTKRYAVKADGSVREIR